MNELISESDRAYLRARYPKTWAHVLDYACATATAYARQHASPCVRYQVAQLWLRYCMEHDHGEKELIRRTIDSLIEQGRWIDAHSS